jgi:hypothetical protein
MSVPRDLTDAHHYHMHDEDGECYGDTRDLEQAAATVAHLNLDQTDILFFVVDAPVCMDACRKD